jgi:hypothetical protein
MAIAQAEAAKEATLLATTWSYESRCSCCNWAE